MSQMKMRYKYLFLELANLLLKKILNFFVVCIIYETVPNFLGALMRSKQLYRHNMNKYFIRYSKYEG